MTFDCIMISNEITFITNIMTSIVILICKSVANIAYGLCSPFLFKKIVLTKMCYVWPKFGYFNLRLLFIVLNT